MSESLEIPIGHADLEAVSGLLDAPDSDEGRSGIVLAHGAGAPMTSPFLESVAAELVARGMPVLRFNYAYSERAVREGRRRPPDRRPVAVHRAALAAARERFGERRVLLAGKSMGGRVSTYLAAEGIETAGLVLFGYPLHPPGRKEKLRTEHFPDVHVPALFLQGTRDALCDLALLRDALPTFGGPVALHEIEDANHDFAVPRKSGRDRGDVITELCDAVARWEHGIDP